jgi:hypothetical protein
MVQLIRVAAILGLAGVLGGCQPRGVPPASLGSEAERIRARSRQLAEAEARKDINTILPSYAEDVGKYLVVWRKIDGEWRIAAVSFSSDGPTR